MLKAPDRATTPLLRNAGGKLVPVDWPTALREFTIRMKAIQAIHGAESIAFLGTGQPCDVTSVEGYRHLDESRGIQWPFPADR